MCASSPRAEVAFLLATAIVLGACNSNGGSGGAGTEGQGLPEIDPVPGYTEEDKAYYLEVVDVYMSGTDAAWEETRKEVLATRGHQGQAFLIEFLAVSELHPERSSVERQEAARIELAETLRQIAVSEDDWGAWVFMCMFRDGDSLFQNTVFVPVCALAGPALFPHVRRLSEEPELKPLEIGRVYKALGATGGKEAVAPLVEIYREHGGEEGVILRAATMEGLGYTGAEEALGPLGEGLKDPDELVRKLALDALLQIGSKKAVGPLIEALELATTAKQRRKIVDRLKALTGVEDIGENASAWAEWYRRNGEEIE